MVGRKRFSIEERKGIYTKRWEVENRDNLAALWYTSGRIWWKVEDNRVGENELLVV